MRTIPQNMSAWYLCFVSIPMRKWKALYLRGPQSTQCKAPFLATVVMTPRLWTWHSALGLLSDSFGMSYSSVDMIVIHTSVDPQVFSLGNLNVPLCLYGPPQTHIGHEDHPPQNGCMVLVYCVHTHGEMEDFVPERSPVHSMQSTLLS